MASLEELRSTRLSKLELLKKAEMNPFPSKVPRTFCLGDAKINFADYEKSGKEVSLAGRIMAIRGQGAILFAVLYDGKGKFQAVFKKDEIEEKIFFNKFQAISLEICFLHLQQQYLLATQ